VAAASEQPASATYREGHEHHQQQQQQQLKSVSSDRLDGWLA